VTCDPAGDAAFTALFDPGRAWTSGGAEPCLRPGLYDFGLGNLIHRPAGERDCLVDWEWTFDAPVPAAFVRFVLVRNTADYLQPLIRALTSPRLPGRIFVDDAVIPERWAELAGLTPDTVRRFVAYEAAFQQYLHVMHRPMEAHVLHADPERVTERRDVNAALLAERLRAEADAERARADELAQAVRDRDDQLAWAARRLSDLSGVRHSARHLAGLVRERVRGARRSSAPRG
jgi:hypothetical protein